MSEQRGYMPPQVNAFRQAASQRFDATRGFVSEQSKAIARPVAGLALFASVLTTACAGDVQSQPEPINSGVPDRAVLISPTPNAVRTPIATPTMTDAMKRRFGVPTSTPAGPMPTPDLRPAQWKDDSGTNKNELIQTPATIKPVQNNGVTQFIAEYTANDDKGYTDDQLTEFIENLNPLKDSPDPESDVNAEEKKFIKNITSLIGDGAETFYKQNKYGRIEGIWKVIALNNEQGTSVQIETSISKPFLPESISLDEKGNVVNGNITVTLIKPDYSVIKLNITGQLDFLSKKNIYDSLISYGSIKDIEDPKSLVIDRQEHSIKSLVEINSNLSSELKPDTLIQQNLAKDIKGKIYSFGIPDGIEPGFN